MRPEQRGLAGVGVPSCPQGTSAVAETLEVVTPGGKGLLLSPGEWTWSERLGAFPVLLGDGSRVRSEAWPVSS